jgi:hypothetical protein
MFVLCTTPAGQTLIAHDPAGVQNPMNYKNIKTPLGTIGEITSNGKWHVYRDNEDKTVFEDTYGVKIYVMDGCSEEDKDEFQEPFKGVDFIGKGYLYHRRKDHMVWIYIPVPDVPIKLTAQTSQGSLF